MRAKYWSFVFVLVLFGCAEARASYLYTYVTSASNPLNSTGSVQDYGDQIIIGFELPFQLGSNKTYDISVNPSAQSVGLWFGGDSMLDLGVSGEGAPIDVVSGSGLLDGGSLGQCVVGQTCFGGAIRTNAAGQIVWWNLETESPDTEYPQVDVLSYNVPSLGSLDVLEYSDGIHSRDNLFAENTLDGAVGTWLEGSVPEPGSMLLMLAGVCGLGSVAYRRRRMHA